MPDIVILTPNTHGNEKTKTVIDKYPEKCGGKTYDYENEFCDIRVGENVVYKKVTITGSIEGQTYSRTWMAENLRYKPSTEGSLCRDDDDSDCSKYGRFYTFDAANPAAANPEGENICPEGWIMPTIIDYVDLVKALVNSTAMITHYDYFYSVRCIMIENND